MDFTFYFSASFFYLFFVLKFCKAYELEHKFRSTKLPWPGDEGNERWSNAWQAIKKV